VERSSRLGLEDNLYTTSSGVEIAKDADVVEELESQGGGRHFSHHELSRIFTKLS
jgi:hypothetical protein